MARSFKKLSAHGNGGGKNSAYGKFLASRILRRKAKALVFRLENNPDSQIDWVDHPSDKIRGHKGSRNTWWKADCFGDGWIPYWFMPKPSHDDPDPDNAWVLKLRRK